MKKYLLVLFCSVVFGQASNEMVTFTQAQSLGFSLNSGQSNVTSNECMTKAQALAKYNLNPNSMSSYSSNQLVPRSVWVGAVALPYSYTLIYDYNNDVFQGFSSQSLACNKTTSPVTVYSASPIGVGVTLYFDQFGTTPIWLAAFNSSLSYFKLGASVVTFEANIFSNTGNIVKTISPCITYTYQYGYKNDPCGGSVDVYYGSDGLYYSDTSGTLLNSLVYSYYGPSYDVYDWHDWYERGFTNGVLQYEYIALSPCAPY